MIYPKPKKTMRQIKVISCTLLAIETFYNLNKFQSWLCKVFKITPQKYQKYRVAIEYENPLQHSYFFKGSIIVDEWDTKLMVYEVESSTRIKVMTLNNVTTVNKPNYIALIAQTTPEIQSK